MMGKMDGFRIVEHSVTHDENDGLMTEEQLKQSLDNSPRALLIRAGYKPVWETQVVDRGDTLLISGWVQRRHAHAFEDCVMVECPQRKNYGYYTLGKPKGLLDDVEDDSEHERQALAVEEQTDSSVLGIAATSGRADEVNRLRAKQTVPLESQVCGSAPSPTPTNVIVETRKAVKFTPSPMPGNIVVEKRKPPRLIQKPDGAWTVDDICGK